MDGICNYLKETLTPGLQWFILQEINGVLSAYINFNPPVKEGFFIIREVRIPTNMIFKSTIPLKITNLYYACTCVKRCSGSCKPPVFYEVINFFDRNGVKANVSYEQYYKKLTPILYFDHSLIGQEHKVAEHYQVLCWLVYDKKQLSFIDADYIDGIPIYEIEKIENLLIDLKASELSRLKFIIRSLEMPDPIKHIFEFARNLNIFPIQIKINL